jgi:hypothetical protein
VPKDPFIREKFTRLRIAAKKLAPEYFERFPNNRYQAEIESWRHLQLDNIEFTIKRLREPIDSAQPIDAGSKFKISNVLHDAKILRGKFAEDDVDLDKAAFAKRGLTYLATASLPA